jgi:hypothetical protein
MKITLASVIPPPPPEPPKNIYRLLKDNELPPSYGLGGKSRTASPEWPGRPMTPATVKLHGADPVTTFPDAAVEVVHALNDPRNAFTYVTRESAGWSNRGQTWPEKMEPIAFEDNLVEVVRVEGIRAYLRMWNGEIDDLCVIHRWWNIDQDSVMHDAQNNITEGPGYIVLAYPGEYWIEIDRLTPA